MARNVLDQYITLAVINKHGWLYALKKAYTEADALTRAVIKTRKKLNLAPVVCAKGCSACCLNASVPILKPEVLAITWFVCECVDYGTQRLLMRNIIGMARNPACPFLLDQCCSIYPLRPLACRHFIVTGKKCSPREDVLKQRPEDILPLPPNRTDRISRYMLQAAGEYSPRQVEELVKGRKPPELAVLMHQVDWRRLCALILQSR